MSEAQLLEINRGLVWPKRPNFFPFPVSAIKELLAETVPANKELLAETVPANKELLAKTVSANNLFLIYKMYTSQL